MLDIVGAEGIQGITFATKIRAHNITERDLMEHSATAPGADHDISTRFEAKLIDTGLNVPVILLVVTVVLLHALHW